MRIDETIHLLSVIRKEWKENFELVRRDTIDEKEFLTPIDYIFVEEDRGGRTVKRYVIIN